MNAPCRRALMCLLSIYNQWGNLVPSAGPRIVDVAREDVKQGLAAGEIFVVDVREPHEYAGGHIPGAVLMPLSAFDFDMLRALDRRIVFSCAAGVRSMHALALAQDAGLPITEHYRGGFRDWAMSGEAVETGF